MTAEKEDSLLTKLRKVQVELKAPKSQYNNFGKYAYRNQEDILEAVKPLLAKYGLTMTISDKVEPRGGDVSHPPRYYVVASVIVVDDADRAYTVTAEAREEETKKGMDGAQITGAASSYARKYALNGMFLIDDTKDADAGPIHNPPAATTPSKPAPRIGITKEQITLMYQTLKDKGYNDKQTATEILKNFGDVQDLSKLTKIDASALLNRLLATDKGVLDTFFSGGTNSEEGTEG